MTLIDCKKHIADVRWILFWVILMQIVSEYVVMTVATFTPIDIHEYILMGAKEILTFLPPLILYIGLREKPTLLPPKQEYRINGISTFNIIIIAIMAICGQFIMMLFNIPMNMIIDKVFHQEITSSVPVVQGTVEFIIGIVFVGIFPAVLEEFWMRGIVFGAFANYSTRSALIFTTVIFALLHAKFSQVLGILFLGFMVGYVLIKTESIWSSVVYHTFSNITALIVGRNIDKITTAKEISIVFGTAIFLFVLSTLIFMIANQKNKIGKGKHDFSIAIGSMLSLPVLLAIIMVVANGYIYNTI